jgi:hypothetical protein
MIPYRQQGLPAMAGNAYSIHYGVIYNRRLAVLKHVLMAVAIVSTLTLGIGIIRYRQFALSTTTEPSVASWVQTIGWKSKSSFGAPAGIPAIDKSQQLQSTLDGWMQTHANHKWSVVVQGLDGDPSHAAANPDAAQDIASIYKLLMMYPLSKKLPRSQWDSTNVYASGKTQSITACVELMLLKSNNPCGEAVAGFVGWKKADAQLAAVGLTHTSFDRNTNSTAGDISIYLKQLYEDKLLDQGDKAYIYSLMQQQIYRGGIPSGCPTCTVRDKTGDTGQVRNDAAIINYGSGRTYTLVVLSNGGSYAEIADLTASIHNVFTD